MSNIDKQALIAKIKKQTESFDTVVLKEDEANALLDELEAAEKRIAELEELEELFLRAKALMHQSGGTPIENSLNPVDAWLYDAEHAAASKGAAS
ncbi:hypothetical protein [Enterobacter hormaechei]|uniref:hypothetical protein n=1 Tax=Enterobacter hormaechei TaxID=158836 RepID=UPI000735DA73|nr:hypothetical protein [Enterobacter hormaechei]KTJ57484.1 hypothetical protein ASU81_01685 [Enterobacter hormaechei subsp. steigerwaltii]MBW7609997.1 hypothetical protein [Enterobacter hormaechei]